MPKNEPKMTSPSAGEAGQDIENYGQGSYAFHHKQMEGDSKVEADQLKAIGENMIEIEEGQAFALAAMSTQKGIEAYEELITKYPKHPKSTFWQQQIDRLQSELRQALKGGV